MPTLVSVKAERAVRDINRDLVRKFAKLAAFKYVPVPRDPVDFSDVLPQEADDPVIEVPKDLWDLVTPVVSFLADFYGIERDDFIAEVLVRAMPTLMECRTAQNPSGKYDLIAQGVWGQPWHGVTVYGIRDASRDVAKGNKDEWMLAPWIEDGEGLPLGIVDGLTAGLDLWDDEIALDWRAEQTIDELIVKAQRLESIRFESPFYAEAQGLTSTQIAYAEKHFDMTREQAIALGEMKFYRLVFGVETVKSAGYRDHADRIRVRLNELYDYVPGDDVVVGEPTPMFTYEPDREDYLSARIVACIHDQAALHVPDGLNAKQEKLVADKIKEAKAASNNDGGFQGILLEADAADKLAMKIKGDEREVLPTYLAPEYPYDYENVSHVMHLLTTKKLEVVERLQDLAAEVTVGWSAMKLALQTALVSELGDRTSAWGTYKRLKEAYYALREANLAEMNLQVASIPRHFFQGISPTELASFCNALAHEIGDQYGMVREAAADALEVVISDEEVWGRLYPAGNLGDEYESLLPNGTRDDVAEFAELAMDKYTSSELAFQFWDSQIARAAHLTAAVTSRCTVDTACVAGSDAFWKLDDSKAIIKAHHAMVLKTEGIGRRMMIEQDDGVWRTAKVRRVKDEWVSEDGATWKDVDADFNVVDLEMLQFHIAALVDNANYSIRPVELRPDGILDPDGLMHGWDVLSRGVRLVFESDERKASFATAVLAHVKDPQAQTVGLSLQ